VNQLQVAPHHRRIRIEVALPKQVAQNNNRLRVLAVRRVGRDQGAAQQSGNAEMNPGITGELRRRNILRQVFVRRCQIPGPPTCRHTLQAFNLAQELKLGAGNPDPPGVTALVHHGQVDHAVGALIRVRMGQQAVDNAENGGGGPDTQR